MAKEITGYCKLQIGAGKANPAPPVGPALGQRGVNIMEFCKAFNEATKKLEAGIPIPVVITVYKDKSFSFTTKLSPVSFHIKREAKLTKASSTPGREEIASISKAQINKIAKLKMEDMNATDITAAEQMVIGSARSMGIAISD